MNEHRRYINENQLSDMIGVALSTLRNNRSKGRGVPYIKLGRSVRYDLNDVTEFMESHKIRTEKYWESE